MDNQPDPLRLAERVAELERQVEALRSQLEPSGWPLSPSDVYRLDESEPPAAASSADPLRVVPPPLPTSPPAPESPAEVLPPVPQERESRRGGWGHGCLVFLRQWQLWPPEGSGSFEVQVGAWWATRIGALLAVIGVVFFGLHLVQNTPPWVRLMQLAAVAVAVTGAGLWLERREAKFGAVVLGSGLGLIFFTGFAAYAVPPLKVIEQPLLAIVWQGVVVAGVTAASFWKNRSGLATMAVVFGFVTCLFTFVEQLPDISLVAALLLSVAAVVLWWLKGWLPPLVCSVVAAYLVFGMIVWFGWSQNPPHSWGWAVAFPVGSFLLFSAADWMGGQGGRSWSRGQRRLLHGLNVAGSAGIGLVATSRYFGESVAEFYCLWAGLLLAMAFLFLRRERDDEAGHFLLAVGTGFVALALIEVLDARTRWVALAVQSLIILWGGRRTRLWTAEALMGAVWLGSAALFIFDTYESGYFSQRGQFWSLWGGATTVYVLLSGLLLSWQARWLGDEARPGDADEKPAPDRPGPGSRLGLNVLYGIILGGVGCAAAWAGSPAAYLPTGALVVALGLAGAGLAARHWVGLLAAGCAFAYGQISFWSLSHAGSAEEVVWINGTVSILSALAVAGAVQWGSLRERAVTLGVMRFSLGVSHGVWLISVQVLLFWVATLEGNLLVASGLALGLGILAGFRRFHPLADLVPVPILLALFTIGWSRWEGSIQLPATGSSLLLWTAVGIALAAICLRDCWRRLEGRIGIFPSAGAARVLGASAATVLALYLLGREFEYPHLIGVFGMGGLFFLLLGKWPGWSAGPYAGLVFFVVGHVAGLLSLLFDQGYDLSAPLCLAMLTLVYAILGQDKALFPKRSRARFLQGCMGVLALGSVYLWFLSLAGALEPYTTVFWGMSAIVVFLSGLVWRIKPLRVIGLVGLGLCLPRVFLVDIHSIFYRIAAFAVVGVVLLLVGFLYHRFRNLINGKEEASEPEV